MLLYITKYSYCYDSAIIIMLLYMCVCVCTCILTIYIFAGYLEAAKRNLECVTPGLVTSPDVAEERFGEHLVPTDSKHTTSTSLQRFQARIVRLIIYLIYNA